MTNYQFEITAYDQPAVLERLLQVTRYRGFFVTRCNVLQNSDKTMLNIQLSVENKDQNANNQETMMQNLYNQINKLFDIKYIKLNKETQLQYQA